ncbi:uroporphyrinogen decarboxylase family protein [Desulfosporosinus hippei]|uniref:Uroporphyrinogen decarboxylase (URO-D) n=1 Tax=Desulfosporosinus hippei DSM 8344 TaxID=1121419 RepID=A0A1G8LCL6_9FIRM|nr:uroporphyrinogen decarboxylase family protein [Desulfosporosinus hippei]SDI53395.1 Uroporphyrinogen decarboxylase (URO-D) [Desulfosporosinus hippei DSM 8344]
MMTKRENALKAYRHETPDYVPCFLTDFSMIQCCPDLERYTGITRGKDYWGCDWTFEPAPINAPMPTPGVHLFEDITEWRDKLQFPDLEAIDWVKQADIDAHSDFFGLLTGKGITPNEDGSSIYDEDKKDLLRLAMILNGPFERLHACMGFQNALMAIAAEPEECREYFKAMADWKIEYLKKIGKYYDLDVIMFHDDYGTNDRMFMSPDTWRKLIKPELARIVKACHEAGMIYEHHSCGFIEPIIPDLVEIGVDALDPIQVCNINAGKLKIEYGKKLTFVGGFNNQDAFERSDSTPEGIKAEYRRAVDLLAPGGSYVAFPMGVAFASFAEPFIEEHFKYGMSFYQSSANK